MTEPGFIRRQLGLDWFDLGLHVALTCCAFGLLAVSNAPAELFPVATGVSLALLGIRRSRALKRAVTTGLTSGEMAARLEESEQRLASLEAAEARVSELEERADFAERLLARQMGDRKLISNGESR